MLKWFRARAGTWALVALCSFTTVGALSTVHELECGDELAEGFVVGHTPGSHTVSAPHVGQKPAHCVLCHWLQSFRAGGPRVSRLVIAHSPVSREPSALFSAFAQSHLSTYLLEPRPRK